MFTNIFLNKTYIIALAFTCILSSFIFSGNDYQIPLDEQIVNTLMNKSSNSLSKKYNMRSCGIGVGMPGGIVKHLCLEFDIVGPLSKEKIRQILINFSDEFLCAINDNLAIRPFLENYPFLKNKVDIVLYIQEKNHRKLEHPNIGIASIRGETLYYKTLITTDFRKVKDQEFETLDEALKILNNEIGK